MSLVIAIVLGAAQLYLLVLVCCFVGAMLVQAYRDAKASLNDFINYVRRKCHEHRP